MDQRNLLIAIVLSVAILIAFQLLVERLHPPPPPGSKPANTPAAQSTASNPPPAGLPD